MSNEETHFKKYATEYDPIKVGSIDGTDTCPHDRALARAQATHYEPSKQDTIKSEFSKFGKILHCRLVRDIVTGKSKQYAFVEYEGPSGAERALRDMHKEVDGSMVTVEREAERRLAGWRPRRLGGGFGGRKESGQLRFGCSERPFKRPYIIQQHRGAGES